MRQENRARLAKLGDNALTVVLVGGYVVFRVGLYGIVLLGFWYLTPIQDLVPWLWHLIPAGARGEVGVGLGITGGLLVLGFLAWCFFGTAEPARSGHGGGRGGGGFSYEFDSCGMDSCGIDCD